MLSVDVLLSSVSLAFYVCMFTASTAEDADETAHVLEVSPAGPIQAAVGTNLTINCTSNQAAAASENTTLRWHVPDYSQQQDRLTISWYAKSTLELSVRHLVFQDAGEYICWSAHHGTRKVLVEVLPITPQPVTVISDTSVLEIIHQRKEGCSEKQFRCADGICIFKTYHCDNIPDCADASDETGCDHGCVGRFRCDNGQCIAKELRCDKFHVGNCRDGSDEKNCDREQYEYMNPSNRGSDHPVIHHDKETWHFNAIYSAVAGIVGLVCVIAIVVITICRIHLQREALQQISRDRLNQDLRRVVTLSRPQRRNVPSSLPSSMRRVITVGTPDQYYMDSFLPQHNVSLNINLHLSPPGGLSEMSALMPPPYSEVDELPRDDTPPPPYSASDTPGDQPEDSPQPAQSHVNDPAPGGITTGTTEPSDAAASDRFLLPHTDLVRAGSSVNEGPARSQTENGSTEEVSSLLQTDQTSSQ